MEKLWAGRAQKQSAALADAFNSSIGFDQRLWQQDIAGSIAHAQMLARCGVLTDGEAAQLTGGLAAIAQDLQSGALTIDPAAEDIHMFIEAVLTERLGSVGKKLHTARSRNDQVALDLRLFLRDGTAQVQSRLTALVRTLCMLAEQHYAAILPGYTHLQRAQPITFGHQLMAYAQMLLRDLGRFEDSKKRLNVSPIGACALAGTTYPTDRQWEAAQLGFDAVCQNSLDAVSDRDFCVEFLSDCAMLMLHLSRLCEELVLYSSLEFGFLELDDAYTTGSSIMPQKKNSDMAELCRGKTGRVYGDLISLLTMLKGLPLAYNKDMQEDKEPVFDALDTVTLCLGILTPMLATMKVHEDVMYRAAQTGFLNATDLADYLSKKGVPFREAYHISGQLVAFCLQSGSTLEALSLTELKRFSPVFEPDVYDALSLEACIRRRTSYGGTAPESVLRQIADVRAALAAYPPETTLKKEKTT